MRLWASCSVIATLILLALWGGRGTYSGGAGMPWEDFLPTATAPMLVSYAMLLPAYCYLLHRRPARLVWFFLLLAAWMPILFALRSCWIHLESATWQDLHRTDASDVAFAIALAEDILLLGLLMSGTLANISVYGYLRRTPMA